ncbi:PREDICTED: farnesyl pyrophosphate synthase 1-like [Papilio polytes]|uniref:farnesyl pyrophosphate synthase 1-like n=1 Tax=Papilio polytes TaxID=76194 RepID=UPI00067629D1|nr:PREDICTED: farnesyl pyrophosphate synthase 1-like [Papilio polytes]
MMKLVNEFDNYVPKIVDESLAKATLIKSVEMKNRIKRVTEYTTMGRRPVQGEFMLFAYESFNNTKHISDEIIHQLKALLLALEMMQSYAIIWDDYDDESKLRFGKTCWHLVDDNNTLALLDGCIMRSFTEEIARQNTKGKHREQVLKILSGTYFTGSVGQHMDTVVQRSKNYDNFTIEQYNLINTYKSAIYSVKTPILMALALSNKLNRKSFEIVDDVCTDIGTMVQIHNDLLNYFDTKGMTEGKTGTDIQEGKCSWVAVTVLRHCTPGQRRIFIDNYGSWDPEKFSRILQLYESMDLVKLYKQEEESRFNTFFKKINDLPKDATPSSDFFQRFHKLLCKYTQNISGYMYDKHLKLKSSRMFVLNLIAHEQTNPDP